MHLLLDTKSLVLRRCPHAIQARLYETVTLGQLLVAARSAARRLTTRVGSQERLVAGSSGADSEADEVGKPSVSTLVKLAVALQGDSELLLIAARQTGGMRAREVLKESHRGIG